MISITDPLIDPGLDLQANQAVIDGLMVDVSAQASALPSMREWWAAWRAMLRSASLEAAGGIKEGLDDDRRNFLERAENVSRAAANLFQRARLTVSLADSLTFWRASDHHHRALWAIRAIRQGLFWVVATEISGEPQKFRLLPEAEALVAGAVLDPLGRPITQAELVQYLNALARGLLWR